MADLDPNRPKVTPFFLTDDTYSGQLGFLGFAHLLPMAIGRIQA
jgi:hypothetical protein